MYLQILLRVRAQLVSLRTTLSHDPIPRLQGEEFLPSLREILRF